MTKSLPGRPVQNNAPRTLERFHICLLLVLGVAFVGAGIVALGFAGNSSAAIGVGAGAVVAAGLIAVFLHSADRDSLSRKSMLSTMPPQWTRSAATRGLSNTHSCVLNQPSYSVFGRK
jgi:hypothetical protein